MIATAEHLVFIELKHYFILTCAKKLLFIVYNNEIESYGISIKQGTINKVRQQQK